MIENIILDFSLTNLLVILTTFVLFFTGGGGSAWKFQKYYLDITASPENERAAVERFVAS